MNMTTVPSNQLKAMQHEIESLKEQVAYLEELNRKLCDKANQLTIMDARAGETITQQAEAIRLKDEALEKIACIGNGNSHGNSIGNCLAIDALAIQPSPDILQARDERVVEAQGKAVSNLITGTTAKQYQEAIDKAYEQGKKDAVPEGLIEDAKIIFCSERVAEAVTKYLRAVGALSYEGTALQGIISGEWRKYL